MTEAKFMLVLLAFWVHKVFAGMSATGLDLLSMCGSPLRSAGGFLEGPLM